MQKEHPNGQDLQVLVDVSKKSPTLQDKHLALVTAHVAQLESQAEQVVPSKKSLS